MYALIGGSGFAGREIFTADEEVRLETPFGQPSAPIVIGRLAGREVAFLHRHGTTHGLAPHRIPYRANLWALSRLKIEGVLAVGTVGGIAPAMGPGGLCVPDQLIDYTWGRESSFFDGEAGPLKHVDLTHPFSEALRGRLLASARAMGATVAETGVYACTQGPRLETAAEVERMRRDGADMIGMTLYPECALAREIELEYAALCVSVNHAAGLGESARGIDFEGLRETVGRAVDKALAVLAGAL